jgi:hypothetical protein
MAVGQTQEEPFQLSDNISLTFDFGRSLVTRIARRWSWTNAWASADFVERHPAYIREGIQFRLIDLLVQPTGWLGEASLVE